jgi:hypothetical protein
MRHQSKNKFAKSLTRFGGGMQNEKSREAFHAMIRERDQLKQKTKQIQRPGEEMGDSSSEEDDSQMDEQELK